MLSIVSNGDIREIKPDYKSRVRIGVPGLLLPGEIGIVVESKLVSLDISGLMLVKTISKVEDYDGDLRLVWVYAIKQEVYDQLVRRLKTIDDDNKESRIRRGTELFKIANTP